MNNDKESYTIFFRISHQHPVSKTGLTKSQYLMLQYDDGATWYFVREFYVAEENDKSHSEAVNILHPSIDGVDFILVEKPQQHRSTASFGESSRAETAARYSPLPDNTSSPTTLRQKLSQFAAGSGGEMFVEALRSTESDGEKSEHDVSKKSPVWQYFKAKKGDFVTFILCNASVKHSGGTSNMISHLKRKHGTLTAGLFSRKRNYPSESNGESAGDETPVKLTKRTRSSSLNTINEAFEKVNSLTKGELWDKITTALMFMIAEDSQPRSIVDDEGFRNFVSVISPLYRLPDRKTFTTLIENRYTDLKADYILALQQAVSYTITCDNWTDCAFQSYLGVTVHILTKDLCLKDGFLGVFPLYQNHTADYLAASLNSIIDEFKLDRTKIMALVTDGAANIKLAAHMVIRSDHHIWCMAHFLSHLVPSVQKEFPELEIIIDKVRKIVGFIRKSVMASDELKRLQLRDEKTEGTALKFTLDMKVRWNSTLYMLVRFLELEHYVHTILLKCKKADVISMLTYQESTILKDIVQLMQPVESVITEISVSSYPTASIIIPIVRCMRREIAKINPTTTTGINFKEKLIAKIVEKFKDVEYNKILAISTILDPRYKRLHFENPRAVSIAVQAINDEIKTLGARVPEEKKEVPRTPHINLWETHDELVKKSANENTIDENCIHELRQYLKEAPIDRHCNPFQYWRSVKHSFPTLYKLAIRYISVIGTSVPSEKKFSDAGHTKNLARNRLTGEHLNQLLFLGSLTKKEWKLG